MNVIYLEKLQGITISCKTTLNISSYYGYLKLAKLYVVLDEILTLLHTAMQPCEANDYMAFNHEVYLVFCWGRW